MDLKKKKMPKQQQGYSLIEVMISIGIFTLLMLGIYNLQQGTISFSRTIIAGLAAQDELRKAMKILSAEIRTAAPSSLGSYALADIATSSFTFYSNIDDDSYIERVRYFLDGRTLKRGTIEPNGAPLAYSQADEIVIDLVNNAANNGSPVFSYYDENYNGTGAALVMPADITAVRLIRIDIIVDADPVEPPSPLAFSTQISLRNLKDNL